MTDLTNIVKPLDFNAKLRSGDYKILDVHGQGPKRFMVARGSLIIGWCETEEEGRAIANEDNRARILAAIDAEAVGALVEVLTLAKKRCDAEECADAVFWTALDELRAALARLKGGAA